MSRRLNTYNGSRIDEYAPIMREAYAEVVAEHEAAKDAAGTREFYIRVGLAIVGAVLGVLIALVI